MALTLVVSEPFGEFDRGDEITDPAVIDAIRASENASRVIQVSDEPVPPPPIETAPSPLQALVNQVALLNQRVAALEAAPPGGGTTEPPPSQLAGARIVDADGTVPLDGDGTALVR